MKPWRSIGLFRTWRQHSARRLQSVTAYKPTVVVNNERAELHVQQTHEKGVLNVTEVPDGGYYLLVADAYPIDNSHTRLELFGPSRGYDVLIRAVKGWASGENLGCPDMTKIG
jgi:hypothetical protein